MKSPLLLIALGALIAVFAALNEHFFHFPYIYTLPILAFGVVFLLVGYARLRAARPEVGFENEKSRVRTSLVFAATVLVAVWAGWSICSRLYPDASISVRWLVAIISFVTATSFFVSTLFRRTTR